MSAAGRQTYLTPLTIWPVGSVDEWGQPSTGTPYTLNGNWGAKTEVMKNDAGEEFVSSSAYYFELPDGDTLLPKQNFMIKRGDHTALPEPPADAERIQKVTGSSMAMFAPDEIPDWEVVT